ncbi:GDSL esterase/lipase 7-like [Actinidia eriantha]|uniref:GDSL esterase/lipase 7-like n=1 Tax=Actinidia eriantha TaxID=165200 RepID=UPI00258364EA|nr:GDSL esterase/lipase 7-like [Actinidia eriantha]
MDDQIHLFERTVKFELPRYYQNSSELLGYLAKSIFVVTMGSNDYLHHFQATISDSTKNLDPQQFAQLLIDQLSTKLERLYNLGARKIVMFEIGPIGCIPSITRQIKHNGTCVEGVNKAVAIFNNHLPSMLKNLNTTLPGSNFVLGHAYSLATDVISNPKLYGKFQNSTTIAWANRHQQSMLHCLGKWDVALYSTATTVPKRRRTRVLGRLSSYRNYVFADGNTLFLWYLGLHSTEHPGANTNIKGGM